MQDMKDDTEIVIPKTERFLESCKELSDYINKNLNLDHKINDEFISKLLKHTKITREEAFKSGIALALGLNQIQEKQNLKNK
nr:hypothetical protein [Fusobacterium gastrosuis]